MEGSWLGTIGSGDRAESVRHRTFSVLPGECGALHCCFRFDKSRDRRARPLTTEVNSDPPTIRSRPKRFSKILRTAGTNELPPVRKTLSTSDAFTPLLSSMWSTQVAMELSSSEIHSSNSARVTFRETLMPGTRKENVASGLIDSSYFACCTDR